MVAYFGVLFTTLFSRRTVEPILEFPEAEPYHDEDAGFLRDFKPWVIVAVLLCVLAYAPTFYDVSRATFFGSPGYEPE
jgi:cytochrome c oxidase subunit 1